jgi:plastocyanin
MRGRQRAVAVALAAALGPAAAAAPARADKEITAAPVNQFTTGSVTMDQGERLTFFNSDFDAHNVTHRDGGYAPLFASPTIGNGQRAFVEGSQFLTTGSYSFYCTLHTFMGGTLTVTSAGTPAVRPAAPPPPPPDRTPPTVVLAITSSRIPTVLRHRKLYVSTRLNEAGNGALKATARSGRTTVTVARGAFDFGRATRQTLGLTLTRTGRNLLARRSSLRVTVSTTARDRVGNRRSASVSRTLRR